MQQIAHLFAELSRLGVTLWCENEELRFRGPPQTRDLPAFAELKLRKAEAIEFINLRANAKPLTLPGKSARPQRLPLSLVQEGWWDLSVAGTDLEGKVTIELSLAAPVSVELQTRALTQLIQRHEILRTIYLEDAQGVEQVVLYDLPPALDVANLEHLPTEEAKQRIADDLGPAFRRKKFDLARGPMLLGQIFVLANGEGVMLLSFHRLAIDIHSEALLKRDLAAFCQAEQADGDRSLPSLDIQYADFAVWQRENLCVDEGGFSYWSARLAGVPPINLKGSEITSPSFQASSHEIVLPKEDAIAVVSAAIKTGVDPALMLVTAAGILLSAWSGQSQTAVGLLVPGRPQGTECAIGSFAHARPFMLDISGDASFENILWSARSEHLATTNSRHIVRSAELKSHNLHRVILSVTKLTQTSDDAMRAGSTTPVAGSQHADFRYHFILALFLSSSGIFGRLDFADGPVDAAKAAWFARELPAFLARVSRNTRLTLRDALDKDFSRQGRCPV